MVVLNHYTLLPFCFSKIKFQTSQTRVKTSIPIIVKGLFATKTTLWIVYFDLALIFFRESLRDAVSFLLKLIEQCECVVYTNLGKYDLKNTITILEICDRHRPFKAYSLKNKYLWVSGWGYERKICTFVHSFSMHDRRKKGFEVSFSKNLLSSSFIISEIPRENTSGFSSKNWTRTGFITFKITQSIYCQRGADLLKMCETQICDKICSK